VEALISINNQLRQPDAAVGVLNVAQKELHMDLKESWWVQRTGLPPLTSPPCIAALQASRHRAASPCHAMHARLRHTCMRLFAHSAA
jgi:hypothetical protein